MRGKHSCSTWNVFVPQENGMMHDRSAKLTRSESHSTATYNAEENAWENAGSMSPRDSEGRRGFPTSMQMMLEGFNRAFLTQREKVQNAAKTISKAVIHSPVPINQQLKKLTGVPFLKSRDKVSFVVGVFLMILIEYFILRAPLQFSTLYLTLVFPLLLWRFVTYHKHKWHYFMLDFCYFVQILAIYFTVFNPKDKAFFKMFFGLANGPLLGAVLLLVFHDIDKVTSLFIHAMPALLSYCVRWCNPELWADSTEEENFISVKDIGIMMLFYVLWQVLYIMKTEVLDRSKLESDPKIITSARYLSLRRPHPVYLAMKARGISSGQVALTLFQTVFTLFTLTTVKFMYEYFYAHAVALLGAIFCATWFGASYYFEEFAVRYQERLEKKMRPKKDDDPKDDDDEMGPIIGHYTPGRKSFGLFVLYFIFTLVCTKGLLHLTIWDTL